MGVKQWRDRIEHSCENGKPNLAIKTMVQNEMGLDCDEDIVNYVMGNTDTCPILCRVPVSPEVRGVASTSEAPLAEPGSGQAEEKSLELQRSSTLTSITPEERAARPLPADWKPTDNPQRSTAWNELQGQGTTDNWPELKGG